MNILCRLGFHHWITSEKWKPSFDAEIIEEVIFKKTCSKCNKKIVYSHLIWDYEENNWTPESF